MTKQIGTTIVPDELYEFARQLGRSGAKVFLTKMDVDHTGADTAPVCSNCNGGGNLMIEYLVTPIGETPHSASGGSGEAQRNPTISIPYKGEWAGKKMRSYHCPACRQAPKAMNL